MKTSIVAPPLADEIKRMGERIAELEETVRRMRTPFPSTLTHAYALERLRGINRLSYTALGASRN